MVYTATGGWLIPIEDLTNPPGLARFATVNKCRIPVQGDDLAMKMIFEARMYVLIDAC